jgi:hypothetical protein
MHSAFEARRNAVQAELASQALEGRINNQAAGTDEFLAHVDRVDRILDGVQAQLRSLRMAAGIRAAADSLPVPGSERVCPVIPLFGRYAVRGAGAVLEGGEREVYAAQTGVLAE